MLRYFVCRHYIKWKGKLYKKGELLPEDFTERDRVRNIYSFRIGRIEVPDEEITQDQPPQQPLVEQPTTSTPETSEESKVSEKGVEEAKPRFSFISTGTH